MTASRRQFLGRLTATLFAFNILPPTSQYHRVWRALAPPVSTVPIIPIIHCDFATYLINQTPLFEAAIIDDITSKDAWLA